MAARKKVHRKMLFGLSKAAVEKIQTEASQNAKTQTQVLEDKILEVTRFSPTIERLIAAKMLKTGEPREIVIEQAIIRAMRTVKAGVGGSKRKKDA